MSDYDGDSDGDYGSDQEWLYVEDHYDEVDELVEHTCPSPMLYDTHEYQEYDPYDYWEDLTYLSDGVYDLEKPKQKSAKPREKIIGKKRKRGLEDVESGPRRSKRVAGVSAVARAKVPEHTGSQTSKSIVLWKPQEQRDDVTLDRLQANGNSGSSVVLLKDWKEQAMAASSFQVSTTLPDDEETMPHVEQEPATGDGFDLGDLQSVAALLSSHDIASILRSKGLDPDAVEVALQALISGEEPDFDDEEEVEEIEEGVNDENEPPITQQILATISAMGESSRRNPRRGRSTVGHTDKK